MVAAASFSADHFRARQPFEPNRPTLPPKLDFLIKKQTKGVSFVPFANERDKLNRLLPIIDTAVSPVKQDTPNPPKNPQTNCYISYKSNKLEINQKLLPKSKQTSHMSIFERFVDSCQKKSEAACIQIADPEKMQAVVSPHKFLQKRKNLPREQPHVDKLIFRNSPIFSFSKTIQKTTIEKMIEESKNHDYDFLEANKAKDFLQKHHTYIPNYAKTTQNRGRNVKTKSDNHEYLMKLLSSGDDIQANSEITSAAAELFDK